MKNNLKNVLIFSTGIITGIIIIFIFFHIKSNQSEITFFDEKAECIKGNNFTVFQALDNNMALAANTTNDDLGLGLLYMAVNPLSPKVLFANNNKPYYDNEKITIPKNKCARQIGIFKYSSNDGLEHVVPIVTIDKK